jgi:hypothetical protein
MGVKERWVLSAIAALVLVLAALSGTLVSWSGTLQQGGEDPHARGPSLECLSCHGPHPPQNAEEIDLARFAVPPHVPYEAPGLTCASCHTYPEELEELSPNGCVGCHSRGGYPLAEALQALTEEVGHPDVISLIDSAPDDCAMCHRGGEMALGRLLHRRHFLGSERFLLHFETGCVRCHSFDEAGTPTVESQPLK